MRKPLTELINEKVDPALEKANQPEAAQSALRFLFPNLIPEDEIMFDRPKRDEQDETLRLSNSLSGGRYFDLGANRTRFSAGSLRKLLSNDDPSSQIADAIRWIEEQHEPVKADLRQQMAEAISRGKFSPLDPMTRDWFDALVAAWPYFRRVESESALFISSNSQIIRGSIRRGLEQLEPAVALEILISSINKAADISVLADLARHFIGDVREEGAQSRSVLLSIYADDIRYQLLTRVQQLAKTGEIWKQSDPWGILWFWHQAIDTDDVKTFIEDEVSRDEPFTQIARGAIDRVYSSTGTYERVNPRSLAHITNPNAIRLAAQKRLSSNDEELRALAERFLRAIEAGESNSR